MIRHQVTTQYRIESRNDLFAVVDDDDMDVAIFASFDDAECFATGDINTHRWMAAELARTMNVDLEQNPDHPSRDFTYEFLLEWPDLRGGQNNAAR